MKNKLGRFPAPGVGLEALVDDFLLERMETRGMSVERVTLFRANLVGLSSPGVIGFTKFLEASGIAEPSARDLSSDAVAAFYEFTIQHYGVLRCYEAVRALRGFWIWCNKNGLTREEKMPPDLHEVKVPHPWKVRVEIAI